MGIDVAHVAEMRLTAPFDCAHVDFEYGRACVQVLDEDFLGAGHRQLVVVRVEAHYARRRKGALERGNRLVQFAGGCLEPESRKKEFATVKSL